MKSFWLNLLLSLLILTTVGIALDANAVVLQPADIPSFLGYAPNKIVVKLDETILKRIDKRLASKGRFGISRLDKIAESYDAISIVRQFPGVKKRMYRGRRIDLSGWHKIHFRKEVDVEKVVEAFKKLAGVIDAQPIGIHLDSRPGQTEVI